MPEFMEAVANAQRAAMEATEDVLRQIKSERAYQFMKWGWARDREDFVAHQHDDEHSAGDWSRFIVRQLGQAEQAIEAGDSVEWRERMLRVAAVAVAAIESSEASDA